MLQIDLTTAKKLFFGSPEWFQEELKKAFGEKNFKTISFQDIKTFEDACEALGITPDGVVSERDTADEAAYKKLKIIAATINQGWTPNWKDEDEKKWFPYFVLSSGFRFSNSNYNYTNTNTNVRSHLCKLTQHRPCLHGKK